MKRIVLALFFGSGACGLVYQVVWVRLMTHVFGATALAVGTVLAAFMSGLALGAWLGGPLADRSRRPLRLYAALEVGVGVAALCAHFMLGRLAEVYVSAAELFGGSPAALSIVRFALAFVLVLVPTLLMGATLPLVTRCVVTRLAAVGSGLGTLYAVNTAGAVAGAVATGFALIGTIGLNGTVLLAALGNVAIGGFAWLVSQDTAAADGKTGEFDAPSSRDHRETTSRDPAAVRAYRWLLFGFALSGLTSFAYEIYWTRTLVFLVGNSTYAVTSMLAAFLTGLALGGLLARRVVDRVRNRLAAFGWVQVGIALTSATALPLLFRVVDPETVRSLLGDLADRAALLALARFAIPLAAMLVPATLIGATFPLVGRIVIRDLDRSGATVGRIYAVNTAGNVAGALLPGWFLLDLLGIQRGFLLMAAINLAVGLLALAGSARAGAGSRAVWRRPVAATLAVAALVTAVGAPIGFRFPAEGHTRRERQLFYREGPMATTGVTIDPDTRVRSMTVDGVVIGGNGFTEYKQLLLAHLPKLLKDDVSHELSVGLGSAILAGESLRHDRVQRLVAVEIAPGVVDGARLFERESHAVLEDPRLNVVVDDVANVLRTTSDIYDVISADEKTAKEYASNGFSYSSEYYALLRGRLAPDGLVAQWVPVDLPPRQFAIVLKTFATSFPHVQVWYFLPAVGTGAYNAVLIGSRTELALDVESVRERMERQPDALEALARYGLTRPEAILGQLLAEDQAVREALAATPRNTLDHPRYEFYSPADYAATVDSRLAANHDFLMRLRGSDALRLQTRLETTARDPARLRATFTAEESYLAGYRILLEGGPERDAFRRLETAIARAPWNENLACRVFRHYWNAATARFTREEYPAAGGLMRRGLDLCPTSAHAFAELAIMLLAQGEAAPAIAAAERALQLQPELVLARRVLSDALVRSGRTEEAAEQLRALLKVEPEDADARQRLDALALR